MAKKVPNHKAGEFIANRIPFEGSNLYGDVKSGDGDLGYTGRMKPEDRDAMAKDKPTYVVSSYGTPIAWHGLGGWKMPATKFSQTTSVHQSKVRGAIGQFLDGHNGARQ